LAKKKEEDEELLIIDDEEDENELKTELFFDNDKEKTPPKKSNLTMIVIVVSILLLLFMAKTTFFYLQSNDKKEVVEAKTNTTSIIKNIKKNKINPLINSKLVELTAKAKKLYKSGNKEEALKIYEKISFFHKSLADFNLGVTLLKGKKYNEAIKHFEKSFELNDLKFESSLNIALAYKLLNKKEKFQSYLKEADKYIISKYDSPLFNYYYALLEYYKNNPIESLAILKEYKKPYFERKKNLILSKEYSYVKNYDFAINSLAKVKDPKYFLTIAQMYAKNGEYSLSANAFRSSINANQYPMIALVGLSLVQNKLGLLKSCATTLKVVNQKYGEKATKIYPIKVIIKKSLHNPIYAQKEFKNSIFNSLENRFGLLFYYAPYKLFNPKQSNYIIEKGAKEIYTKNINSAYNYLLQANSISKINLEIIKGLKLLEKHKVYEANALFKTLIEKYPNHSILHYNLALTYANISDYKNANKHFNKSYILDNKNKLAIFFASFTNLLQNKYYDTKTLENILKYSPKKMLSKYKILYKILKNDTTIDFTQKIPNNPFELITNIIASNMVGNISYYEKYAKRLKKVLPKDLIANIIYVDQISQNKSVKEYARAVQEYLARKSIDISPLLYGETFARELYIRILNIGGITRYAKKLLENEFIINKNQIALLQSLAYTYIYTKEYQKSYDIYNKLIDKFKVKDPHTLFLASVASIGSNHHSNAVALLELANLGNRSFDECRYALGLLYQEAKNFESAAIEYAKVGNSGFKSKYFDFVLKPQ